MLSPVRLLATLWTVALQLPLFMVFFRQASWSGLPFLSLSYFNSCQIQLYADYMFYQSSSVSQRKENAIWKIFIFLAHKMQQMLAFRVRTKPTAQLCKHLGKCSQFSRERTLNRMNNQEKANPKVIQMLTINKDFKVVIISVTHEVKKT